MRLPKRPPPLSQLLSAIAQNPNVVFRRDELAVRSAIDRANAEGWTYEQTGRFEKAMQVLERQHAAPELITSMREAFRSSGPSGYWRVLIKDALERSRRQYVSGYRIARLQALSGAGDDAIRSLQRSAQEQDSELVYLKVERTFDSIRSDPRFVALVNRVGIP